MRFADLGAPAPPLPARLEAWPGGVLVTPIKAEALAAFHARRSASAGTATAAAAEATAAAAAVTADFDSEPQPRLLRQRREGPATKAAAEQQQPPPDRCAFFYSHEIGEYACFSQFFQSAFTDGNQIYSCMQQYMMAEKAKAMGDESSRALLLAAEYDPAEFKRLGRLITPWSQEIWDDVREAVITQGNLLKFG